MLFCLCYPVPMPHALPCRRRSIPAWRRAADFARSRRRTCSGARLAVFWRPADVAGLPAAWPREARLSIIARRADAARCCPGGKHPRDGPISCRFGGLLAPKGGSRSRHGGMGRQVSWMSLMAAAAGCGAGACALRHFVGGCRRVAAVPPGPRICSKKKTVTNRALCPCRLYPLA